MGVISVQCCETFITCVGSISLNKFTAFSMDVGSIFLQYDIVQLLAQALVAYSTFKTLDSIYHRRRYVCSISLQYNIVQLLTHMLVAYPKNIVQSFAQMWVPYLYNVVLYNI